jgi:hypothetical protein
MKDPVHGMVEVIDVGLIPYKEAWDLQTSLHQQLVATKRAGYPTPNAIISFCVNTLRFLPLERVAQKTICGSMSRSGRIIRLNILRSTGEGISLFMDRANWSDIPSLIWI